MRKVDETKKKIEQDQRDRIKKEKAQGIDHTGKYFQKTESAWLPKKDVIFIQPAYKGNIFFKDSFKPSPPPSFSTSSSTLPISNGNSATVAPTSSNTNTVTPTLSSTSSVPSTVNANVSNSNGTATPKKKSKKRISTMESSVELSDKEDKDTILATTSAVTVEVPTPEKELIATTKQNRTSNSHSNASITNSNGSADLKQKKRLSITKETANNLSLLNSGTFETISNSKENGAASGTSIDVASSGMKYLSDETNILTGWMKMRNSMKLWINRWVVLRPGRLIYYKDDKDMLRDRCAGILRLADCEVKERPTNKDGFSFKIYHLLHYPIYHKYGLKGETLKLAMLPVSWNYCIFRVTSEQERRSWMEAISTQIEYANSVEARNHHPKDRAYVFYSLCNFLQNRKF